jgi:hypothetical protein
MASHECCVLGRFFVNATDIFHLSLIPVSIGGIGMFEGTRSGNPVMHCRSVSLEEKNSVSTAR